MKPLALALAVGALACITAIGSSQAAPVAGELATAKSSSTVTQVHYYHHHHYWRHHHRRWWWYHHHHMW